MGSLVTFRRDYCNRRDYRFKSGDRTAIFRRACRRHHEVPSLWFFLHAASCSNGMNGNLIRHTTHTGTIYYLRPSCTNERQILSNTTIRLFSIGPPLSNNLLCSPHPSLLSPSSDPGSYSRLFFPPTHYGSYLAFLSREDFSSFFPRLPASTCAYPR